MHLKRPLTDVNLTGRYWFPSGVPIRVTRVQQGKPQSDDQCSKPRAAVCRCAARVRTPIRRAIRTAAGRTTRTCCYCWRGLLCSGL